MQTQKTIGVHGRYTYEVGNIHTGEVELKVDEPKDNLILDSFLDLRRNYLLDSPNTKLQLGDGDHPDPLPTDTALGNLVHAQTRKEIYFKLSQADPDYIVVTQTFSYRVSGLNANITEIGLAEDGILRTKTKTKDALGNVSSVELTDDKYFDIDYEITSYIPRVLATGTIETPFGTTGYTVKTVYTSSNWNPNVGRIYFGGAEGGSYVFSLKSSTYTHYPTSDLSDIDPVTRTFTRTLGYAFKDSDQPLGHGNDYMMSEGYNWPYRTFFDTSITIPAGYDFKWSFTVKWGRMKDIPVPLPHVSMDQQRASTAVIYGNRQGQSASELNRYDFNGTSVATGGALTGRFWRFRGAGIDKVAIAFGGMEIDTSTSDIWIKVNSDNTTTQQAVVAEFADKDSQRLVGFDDIALMYGGVTVSSGNPFNVQVKTDANGTHLSSATSIALAGFADMGGRLVNNAFYTGIIDSDFNYVKDYFAVDTDMVVKHSGQYIEGDIPSSGMASAHIDHTKTYAFGARGDGSVTNISDFRTYKGDGSIDVVESATAIVGGPVIQEYVHGARVCDGTQARATFYGGSEQTDGGDNLVKTTLFQFSDTKTLANTSTVFAVSEGYLNPFMAGTAT